VLLIGLAMAANYTLLGNALKPVFATTGHLPFSEPGSSDRRRSVLAQNRRIAAAHHFVCCSGC
jgi:hypothetical protein